MALAVPPALRHAPFRLWFAAAVPFVLAIWAQRVAFGWLAWTATEDAGFVGLVAALQTLPMVLVGPVFGAMVDRAEGTAALRATSLGMASLVALAAWAEGAGALSPALLCVLALGVGVATAGHHPVRLSLAPRLAPPEAIPSVVALGAVNFNLARLAAPVVTGAAIAAFGPGVPLAAAAAMMVPLGLVAGWLEPRALEAPRRALLQSMREGAAHVLAHAPVARAFALTAVMSVVLRGYLELLPVMASGVHERGADGLGWLMASAGLGALAAAVARVLGASGGVAPMLAGGMVAVAVTGQAGAWGGALMGTAAVGFVSTWCGVGLQQAVQAALPDALRGRVMSLWVVAALGAVALGAGALGALANAVGLPWAMVAGGAVGLIATLPFLRARPT